MKTKNRLFCFYLLSFVLMFVTSCKTDEVKAPVAAGTVTDIDGNVYHAITIGTQTWMVENLRTTRYNNGDTINIKPKSDSINITSNGDTIKIKRKGDIINVANNSVWSSLIIGAQCTYSNTTNTDTISKFGRFYNFYAVIDSRNIAPKGWHVPTSAEWIVLQNFVSNNFIASSSLPKALAATTDWVTSMNLGAVGNDLSKNNSSGFFALPYGYRNQYGVFVGESVNSQWWSSSNALNTDSAWYMGLFNYYYDVIWSVNIKQYGLSVRCIKDSK
jgi:uncharacterized protein (TIGR02145 family)